jgi:hypothetical protein
MPGLRLLNRINLKGTDRVDEKQIESIGISHAFS